MTIKAKYYNGSKFEANSEKINETIYTNVKSVTVEQIPENEIYAMGFDCTDVFNEYCIITFENGETSMARNSYIDVFRV